MSTAMDRRSFLGNTALGAAASSLTVSAKTRAKSPFRQQSDGGRNHGYGTGHGPGHEPREAAQRPREVRV